MGPTEDMLIQFMGVLLPASQQLVAAIANMNDK